MSDSDVVATLRALREDARRAVGTDEAWSLADVLDRLADAADHLALGHSCDAHGYEEARAAATRARELAPLVRVLAARVA